ncbi:hypothetical protein C7212DRAFT_155822 [Tuber magnatum]|uniref:DDE-1 domain-containing protein n=1 Tax=Tuber magnatum TaxID=42249 RepID=A0A317SWJ6_9PEZI|nr:hypothetical protein C7212DRAFT_155822 [Tuber magnatum]
MNDKIGFLLLIEVFEPEIQSGQHCLLIIDSHSSYLIVEFIEFCFNYNTYILCFSSHSTDLHQLLDVGYLNP